ncbi:MAG TPA: hypothetical protein VF310_09500 [Vicinamibacteria bacterium]
MAVARASCLYCGAALPEDLAQAVAVAATARQGEPEPGAAATRALLVLDLEEVVPERLARALALTDLEARLWVTQGGFRLQRLGPPAEVQAEAERLRGGGVRVEVLAEAEVRAALPPRLARGGRPHAGGLELELAGGVERVGPEQVLLLVEGPIAREYQTQQDLRRVRTASLAPGYRLHLHLRDGPQPLELDPGGFDFGGPRATRRSTLLELQAWLAPLRARAPSDDSFQRALPALGPSEPSQAGPLSAANALRAHLAEDGQALVLDNLAQFRFFSAWRGVLQRRRAR